MVLSSELTWNHYFLAWVFATAIRRLYVPYSVTLAQVLVSTPSSAPDGSWLLRRHSVVQIDKRSVLQKWTQTHAPHLDLLLATKNWNLFFRIHVSAEVESFYFKFPTNRVHRLRICKIFFECRWSKSCQNDRQHGVPGTVPESRRDLSAEASRIVAIM